MIKNAVFDMGNVLSVYDPERYLNRTVDDPKAAVHVGMTAHLFTGTRELRNFLEQSGIL